MSTTLLALERLIARELGYFNGICTAAGSTTTIIDSTGDTPFDIFDSDTLLSSAWAKIEDDSSITPLNVGEVRRIKADGGYTPASSTVTVVTAFSNATTTTQMYGIYLGAPPVRVGMNKGLLEYINDFLRAHRYRHYSLLSLVTDADMEASGVTNWTSTNSSSSKITTAAKIGEGKQALQVTTSAADGYVQSGSVPIAGTARTLCVAADVAANTGTAKLQLWDVTNGAEIASASTTSRAPTTIWLTSVTVPSTCHSVAVRLIGTGNGDVAVWDNISLRPAGPMTIALPSWVTNEYQVERLQFSSDRGSSIDSNVLVRDSREFVNVGDFRVISDLGAANAFRVSVPPVYGSSHLFAVGQRYFAELSADTDTTDADQDWVKWAVLAAIYTDKGEQGAAANRAKIEAYAKDRTPVWNGRGFKMVGI